MKEADIVTYVYKDITVSYVINNVQQHVQTVTKKQATVKAVRAVIGVKPVKTNVAKDVQE